MTRIFRASLICCFFMLCALFSVQSFAQTLNKNGSVPDLAICGTAKTFTVKIIKGREECNTAQLKFEFPEGMTYEAGTVNVKDGSTTIHSTVSNVTAVGATISLSIPARNPSGEAVQELSVTFNGRASCKALDLPVDGREISYTFTGCGETENLKSNGINLEYAKLAVEIKGDLQKTMKGGKVTRTIIIKNTTPTDISGISVVASHNASVKISNNNAGWTYDKDTHSYFYAGELKGNQSISLIEEIQVNDCFEKIESSVRAFYGCDGECTAGSSKPATAVITIDDKRPNVQITNVINPEILCLNTAYDHEWTIVNKGTTIARNVKVNLAGGSGSTFNNIVVDGNGFSVSGNLITIDSLGIGESRKIKFKQFYPAPSASGGDCSKLDTRFDVGNTSYSLNYVHNESCDANGNPKAFSESEVTKNETSYGFSGQNIGEIDIIQGVPYMADFRIDDWFAAAEGMGEGASFTLNLELSPAIAAGFDVSNVKLFNGERYLTTPGDFSVTEVGGKIQIKIIKGSDSWPESNMNLGGGNWRLQFPLEMDCTKGDAWYKIAPQFSKGKDCAETMDFKCETVKLNAHCEEGECLGVGGMVNGQAKLTRVEPTYLDGDNNTLPDSPITAVIPSITNKVEVRSFIGGDILRISQKGRVSGNDWTIGGTFEVSLPSDFTSTAVPNSGILVLTRNNVSYTVTGLPVVASGTDAFHVQLPVAGVAGLPTGFVGYEQSDIVLVSMDIQATTFDGKKELKKFPTKLWLSKKDDPIAYACGSDYTATGYYGPVSLTIGLLDSKAKLTGCTPAENGSGFSINLNIANRSSYNALFINEFRQVATPGEVTMTIPTSLVLTGYVVELVGNHPKDVLRSVTTGLDVSGTTHTFDLAPILEKLKNGQDGKYLDEGFIVRVRPLVIPKCDAKVTEYINTTVKVAGTFLYNGKASIKQEITSAVQAIVINTESDQLDLIVAKPEVQTFSNRVSWILEVKNKSGSRSFGNVWLQGQENVSSAKLISVQQVTGIDGLTAIGSPANAVNGIYQLGDISKSKSQFYLITGEYDHCEDGTLVLASGSDCFAYPTAPSDACMKVMSTTLKYSPQSAELQTLLVKQPEGEHRPVLCAPMDYIVRVVNGGGEAKDMFLKIPIGHLQGLSYVKGTSKASVALKTAPDSAGIVASLVPFADADGSGELVDGSLIIKIPASIFTKLGQSEIFYVAFQLVAEGCDFKSGQKITVTPSGKNFCGSDIKAKNIVAAVSNRLILKGAPDLVPEAALSSAAVVNVAKSGDKLTATYSSKIINAGKDATYPPITGEDSFDPANPTKSYIYKYAIKLPADWAFDKPESVFPATDATYLRFHADTGYIFNIKKDIIGGKSLELKNAKMVYVKDASLLDCTQDFGKIHEELYTLFKPEAICDPVVECVSQLVINSNSTAFKLSKPKAPTGTAHQIFCEATDPTLADVVLTAASVSVLDWFADATSTVSLPLTTALKTGTYYAVNRLVDGSACMSERFAVKVTVDEQPVVTAGANQVQYDSGVFSLVGSVPTGNQEGTWTLVSTTFGAVDITTPSLYNSTVKIENGAIVVLKWTVTNGTCTEEALVTLNFNRQIDLAITKKANKDTNYIVGEEVTYNIVVENKGESILRSGELLKITETIPAGLTNVSYTPIGGIYDHGTSTFKLTQDLQVGGTVALAVKAKIDNAFKGTTITNNVAVIAPAGVTEIITTNNKATETITVDRKIDLSITKTANPEPVATGQELSYTITITNNGPATLNQGEIMTVTETLPIEGFIDPIFTAVDDHAYDDKTGAFTLGKAFAKGESIVLTVKGLVPADFLGSKLVNTVSVAPPSTVTDTDLTNNTATATSTVVRKADLAVVKSADKNVVIAGKAIKYTIKVTNNGLTTLLKGEEIGFNETLPAELTAVKITYPTGAVYTESTKKLSLAANMKTGDSFEVFVEGTVKADFDGTSITNTVVVATPTGVTDDKPNNNTATVTTDVERVADLGVVKVVDKVAVSAGEKLTYTITVTNHGTSTLLKDEVLGLNEQLPAGLNNVTYDAIGGVFKAANNTFKLDADLPEGASVTLKVLATVDANYKGAPLINKVEVSTPDGVDDSDPNNNEDETTTTVGRSADLAVTKVANKTTVTSSEDLEYTIVVTNKGVSTLLATEVIGLDEQLPAGLTNVRYTPTGGTYNAATKSFTLATDLVEGGTVELKVLATVKADYIGKTLVNTVKVTTPTGVTDADPTNNDATVTTNVVRKADLAVVKVADKTTVTAGEALNYTITVTNKGVSTLVVGDVIGFDEQLPTALTNVTFTSVGGTYNAKAKTFTLNKALATGASFEVKVSTTVAADYTANTIVNTVKVTTPEGVIDEDPTNNESSVTTKVERKADLGVEKFTDKSAVVAGEDIAYRIVVKNNGNSSILKGEHFGLVETISAALENVRFTSTDGTYDFASSRFTLNKDLEKGGSVVLNVTARVKSSTEEGYKLINHVKVSTPTGVIDEDPTNDESEVVTNVIRIADLKVEKTVLNSKPLIGLETTFTVTVTNNGPSDATGTTVFDKLKSGYEFVSATTSKGTYDAGTGLWTIGDMPLGAKATMSMIVRVLATGDYDNTAIVNLVETDNIIENNEVTITPTPIPAPPIAVDDAVTTKSNTPVDIFILDNDKPGLTNSPLVPGSVEIITQPKNGTITIDENGKVIYTPNHGYVGQDDFVYRVKDELGFWSNEATVTITIVANDLFIPNVFTPNGDGKNDNFVIIGIEGYERIAITIVNRWGNEVYRNDNYDNTWNGRGLNEGTYYYIITPYKNGKSEVIKGWVLIKKR